MLQGCWVKNIARVTEDTMAKKQGKRLYEALKTLLSECVDEFGLPKKPTVITLYKAKKEVNRYEKENDKPLTVITEKNVLEEKELHKPEKP